MRIHASTKLSLPWDNSSDSFYTQASNDDTTSTTATPEDNQRNPNPTPPAPSNPYQPPTPPPQQSKIMNFLRSWIIPKRSAQPPTVLPTPAVPTIIEIVQDNTQNLPLLPPRPTTKNHCIQIPPITTGEINGKTQTPFHFLSTVPKC